MRRAAPRPAGPPRSPSPSAAVRRRAGPGPALRRRGGAGRGSCPALLCGPCQLRARSSPLGTARPGRGPFKLVYGGAAPGGGERPACHCPGASRGRPLCPRPGEAGGSEAAEPAGGAAGEAESCGSRCRIDAVNPERGRGVKRMCDCFSVLPPPPFFSPLLLSAFLVE